MAVHHLRPVESGHNPDEMERLCFDESNLQVLCYECHKLQHQGEHGNGKAGHMKAEAQRIERYEQSELDLTQFLL